MVSTWCIVAGIVCLAGDAGTEAIPQANLPSAEEIRNIPFQKPTAEQWNQALSAMRSAAEQLENHLDRQGDRGQRARELIDWQPLREAMDQGTRPDPDAVHATFYRLLGGEEGFEQGPFVDLRRSMRRFRSVDSALHEPDAEENFLDHRDNLAQAASDYQNSGGNIDLTRIRIPIAWMERHGQAEELVERFHREFGLPNFYLSVSADFLAGDLDETINESQPIRTTILGTTIRGQEHTRGTVSVTLRPNRDEAVLQIHVQAVSNASTVGRNGPVCMNNVANTVLEGRQDIVFNPEGVAPQPPRVQARTSSQLVGLSSTVGFPFGGIVRNVARRRIAEQRGQANQITQAKAEDKLRTQMERQSAEWRDKVNGYIEGQLRRPLAARDAVPEQIALRSTESKLTLQATIAANYQLGAGSLPPKMPEDIDFHIRLESSACNNLVATLLAGRTIPLSEFWGMVEQVLGPMPALVEALDVRITFDRRYPILFVFRDDEVMVTFRCPQFRIAGQLVPGADISARHRIETAPEGIRAVRLGDLTFTPHDASGGAGRAEVRFDIDKLTEVLREPFDQILRAEIDLGDTPFAEALRPLQTLELKYGTATGGWLCLGWREQRTSGGSGSAVR